MVSTPKLRKNNDHRKNIEKPVHQKVVGSPSQSTKPPQETFRKKAKPKLRGVSHFIAFFISLYTGCRLCNLAPVGTFYQVLLYSFSISGVFGASALLHCTTWRTRKYYRIMRIIDHSMVFVLIASTYTLTTILPYAGRLLVFVGWAGALMGIAFKVFFFSKVEVGPKMITSIPYLLLGWASLLEIPNIQYYITSFGYGWVVKALIGGLSVSGGALAYTFKKPNLIPGIFGFHELLHISVIFCVYCFYLCAEQMILHPSIQAILETPISIINK